MGLFTVSGCGVVGVYHRAEYFVNSNTVCQCNSCTMFSCVALVVHVRACVWLSCRRQLGCYSRLSHEALLIQYRMVDMECSSGLHSETMTRD